MNAFKHNLTGNNLILQEHEYQKYTELSEKLMVDLKPRTEFERQIAQKIIDTNFRLNRLAAIENNILNFDMMHRETNRNECDRTEVMLAQARAWKDDARTFDILGRYESRLTRQLLLYKKELDHLVDMRLSAASEEVRLPAAQAMSATAAAPSMDTRLSAAPSPQSAQADHKAAFTPEMASFGRIPIVPPATSCPVP